MLLLGMTRGEIFLVVALFLLVYAAGFLKRGGDALERLFSAARGEDDGASATAEASSGAAAADREGARKKDSLAP